MGGCDIKESARSLRPSTRLTGRLYELYELAGYSLRELERLTGISDSSWSRYLSGTALPSWSAVAALCRLANREPEDLLALWQEQWRGRKGTTQHDAQLGPNEQLAARLRYLHRISGQTLRQLEHTVHVSDSALSRYLSGQVVPPWSVVQALCRLANQDPGNLRRLWEQTREEQRIVSLSGAPRAHAPSTPVSPPSLGHADGTSYLTWTPPGMGHFAGRDLTLASLTTTLTTAGSERPIVVLQGPPGIGKTAFATEVARGTRDAFSDGQLWIDLRGDDPQTALTASGALTSLLRRLGVGSRLPAHLDELVATYQSTLDRLRILVVLDNASGTQQLLPLLPGSPGCGVIVCSRRILTALSTHHATKFVTLDPLTRDESLLLWQRAVGPEQVRADGDAAYEIVELCHGFPVALRIAAARMTAEGLSAADLLKQLRNEQTGLSALSVEDGTRSLRALFESTYRGLEPATQRVFRTLGRHPTGTFTTQAAAAMCDMPAAEISVHLAGLVDHHLVTSQPGGHYLMYGLIRWYAAEQ